MARLPYCTFIRAVAIYRRLYEGWTLNFFRTVVVTLAELQHHWIRDSFPFNVMPREVGMKGDLFVFLPHVGPVTERTDYIV